MSKQKEVKISMSSAESDQIAILFFQKSSADALLRDYLLRILGKHNLDPKVWGVSKDFTVFEKIQAAPEAAPAKS